ncbi:MAG: Hsp20/alpha crystallin family protein [Treponema sp.]|jgi:HSP20 family protein|nr:Hsp20/alpha crystallin family protein [Treponema sp.]
MKTISIYRPGTIQNALSDFDRYFESFSSSLPERLKYLPAVDIQETDNAYVLDMDLPGFDEKTIEVNIDGANLTISSKEEVSEKKNEDNNTYILRERKFCSLDRSFTRSFKLPENADSEAVSASFKNGTLNLEIKKRAEAQKRLIQINAA